MFNLRGAKGRPTEDPGTPCTPTARRQSRPTCSGRQTLVPWLGSPGGPQASWVGWRGVDRPSAVLDAGFPADFDVRVCERRGEPVAAVVLPARSTVVPDGDAHRPGRDAVLQESGERLRVQPKRHFAKDVFGSGRLGPVRLRELHVLLRGEVRHLPVPERPREPLDESAPLGDRDIRHEGAVRALLDRSDADLARGQVDRPARRGADGEVLIADHPVMDVRLPFRSGETKLQLRPVVRGHSDVDGSGNEAGDEVAERREPLLIHRGGRFDHRLPLRVVEIVSLGPFAGDRANRDGDVLRHLLERLVGVCLLSLEHRRELLARDRRHGSGIARAKEPDVRVHVVEQADAMAGHAMETLDGVVLEIAIEQGVRLEPERRIGPCFLAFQRGLLCEFDRMRIRRDEHDLVRFRSKASFHDAFRQGLRADHKIPGPVCTVRHKRIPGRRSWFSGRRQLADAVCTLGRNTGNYLFGRGLRAARRPGETLLAGLEEARKDALEVAQEADAPPKARTEDAAAVSGPFRQRYLAAPRDTTWHGRGAVHSRPRLHLVRTRDPLRDRRVRSGDRIDERAGNIELPWRHRSRSSVCRPMGLGLLFFGYALDHPEVLWDRVRGRRILATFLLFADGAIHIVAVGEHVESVVVAFFLVLAPLEFVGGFTILRASRPIVWAWLLGALGLIGLYVASRLIVLPFVSQQYVFGPLGLISKAIEGVLAFALAQELWTTSTARRPRAARPATQS